jgi:hypothetical protein
LLGHAKVTMIAITTGITTKTDGMIARSAMSIATDRIGSDLTYTLEMPTDERLGEAVHVAQTYSCAEGRRCDRKTTGTHKV